MLSNNIEAIFLKLNKPQDIQYPFPAVNPFHDREFL